MAEKKVTRKELLKEPDEFMTTTGAIVRYTKQNPNVVTGIAILIVVALVVFLGITNYQKYKSSRSHELFQQAHRAYEMATTSPDTSPETWDNIFREFETVAKDYPSMPAGEMALLYSGHVLYQKGDYKGVLEKYNRMQSTNLVKNELSPLVMYHIAMTRFALKDYDQALTLFDQLSKDINSPYRREAFASIARIYEAQGKSMEAVQAYKQYLKMFPEAPDALFIKTRISDLSAKA